ncbi:unnamed protein product, partial [Mesorhabditis belari]|uniref:Uncharacterized protein n=1 Tax=Mesorhabditis belari TaxID=2138241 RepID=A0AAF3ERG4_9BILA
MIFYFGPIGTPFIRLDAGLYTLPGYMYQINHYSFMQPDFGNIFDTLITVHYYLLGTLCVIALVIDGFTLQRFRKRMMLLTHGMNLCYWIMFFVINALSHGYGSQDIFRYIYGQRSFNRISTIVMTVENVLQGLLIIYFNSGEKGERRSNNSSVNTNTTKTSGKLILG